MVETCKLLCRKFIEVWAVASHKVRKHGTRSQGLLVAEALDNRGNVVLRIETKATHSRVEFDMHRILRDAFVARCRDEGIE